MESKAELVFEEGEKIFLPFDENEDKKCYEINNIENWAECFYNFKSGIILERYKQLMSKTENSKFFEALNYEYGINNYPLDTNKAFQIYKEAANKSPDALSMFRLYRIYKKDFEKFNIKKRNMILEKFYLMKCYGYLLPKEKTNQELLAKRFNIYFELHYQILNSENKMKKWYIDYFNFLIDNYKFYNLNIADIIFTQCVVGIKLLKSHNEIYFAGLKKLEDQKYPEAIYNLATYYADEEKSFYLEKYEKLYNMNYYRCFSDYMDYLDYGKDALNIVKKSLLNGYFSHIRKYKEIFFMIHNYEDIFKVPELKSELMFIIGGLIDLIITDNLESLYEYFYFRKITIKHFNFGDIFKNNFDLYSKEILNYLLKFMNGTNEENKKQMIKYFVNEDFYQELYLKIAKIYFIGVNGIMEKNYEEALDKLNFIEKNNDFFYDKAYHFLPVYKIKVKNLKALKSNENNDSSIKEKIANLEKELIKLEKDLIEMNFDLFNLESMKKFPPSIFFILSKFYSTSSINNQDIILEYVLLNRASNAKLLRLKGIEYDCFEELYLQSKARKLLEERNKEENFNKIKMAKGAINIEGYGEDGTLCPICFTNKKSVICLPCKHFFCKECLDKIIEDQICSICRAKIKITFDINLKKENLIKSIINKSYGE